MGNLLNGYVIGLTGEGAELCARLAKEDLEPEFITSVNEALFEHLERGSFFDDEPTESEDDSRVVAAYLHVTQRCNLNCAGCYSDDEGRNVLADASLADIECALDGLADVGLTKLVISGGEPFLREDLPEIVGHAKESCGIRNVTVLSNGTCVRDDMLERMRPFVDCVSVSFDGWSADCVAYIRER